MTTLLALVAVAWTVFANMHGMRLLEQRGDGPGAYAALYIGSALWLAAGAALHSWWVS